jgi:hypothetical protein
MDKYIRVLEKLMMSNQLISHKNKFQTIKYSHQIILSKKNCTLMNVILKI